MTLFLSNPVLATERKGENLLALSVQYHPYGCWWCGFARQRQGQKLKVCHFSWLTLEMWDQGQSHVAARHQERALLHWESCTRSVLCQPWRASGTAAPNCRDPLEPGLPSALGESHTSGKPQRNPKTGAEAAEWTLLNTVGWRKQRAPWHR